MRFLTMWYVRPTKPQISLRIRSSESTHVKIPHDWKSHVMAQIKCVENVKVDLISK